MQDRIEQQEWHQETRSHLKNQECASQRLQTARSVPSVQKSIEAQPAKRTSIDQNIEPQVLISQRGAKQLGGYRVARMIMEDQARKALSTD